ncbi:ran-binding protein 3-like [Anolis carolinensis]|uniref:Ran-binding protein 3-like n=1 Tax=Anolis carolinensis TaxID=28377 RepID=H9GQJ5_ANOCA|nr:PREDICTED: ran-binding protein 3-like [Anolis carolinensis]|eukprot:XP_003224308.1 PREDICTED: ran-binding protein 3-like [Anolis carolinensis]
MKGKPHFIKRRDSRDMWTMNQGDHMVHILDSSEHNAYCEDRSVVAQPIFVFKKTQPNKRPAEDPVCKTENVSTGCSRKRPRSSSFSFQSSDSQLYKETVHSPKRLRSSSFTILPTFPPSQPVKKNNIFMTSIPLQKNIGVKATEKGIPPTNVQWDVLKPAVLQPPQASMWSRLAEKRSAENVLSDNYETDTEVSQDTCSWTDITDKQPFSLHMSCPKIIGNQLSHRRTISNSRQSNFIFGENIIERVLRPEKSPELLSENEPHNCEKETTVSIGFHTNSSWTNFVKGTTLAESAAAYISNKPRQRYLLDKVEVKTGEEAEHNVLQINCKLFLFDKASLSWIERGSGSLRLNDTSSNNCGMLQSRLVMRNQGSMRLVLNTKLWTQMIIGRANRKSLCITATDLEDCSVKVFLIQASSKDTASLYAAIHHRLIALRNSAKHECNGNRMEPEPDIQQLNCDSDEDESEKITRVNKNRSDHSKWIRRHSVVCS